jgi:hypothetical protein
LIPRKFHRNSLLAFALWTRASRIVVLDHGSRLAFHHPEDLRRGPKEDVANYTRPHFATPGPGEAFRVIEDYFSHNVKVDDPHTRPLRMIWINVTATVCGRTGSSNAIAERKQ